MSLLEKINIDLRSAMLKKDQDALRALRSVKSALLLAQTSGKGDVTPADEVKLLSQLVKQRRESIELYVQQDRKDLADPEEKELNIIQTYLPAQLSEDQLKSEITLIISELGASSAADLGKVMGAATKKLAGKADNKDVANLVRSMLS